MRSGRSSWRTFTRPAGLAWRELRRLGHRRSVCLLPGAPGRSLRARLTGRTWCVSFVTLGELTKWTVLRSWGPRKRAEMAGWLDNVVILPYSEAVAVTWGELQARAMRRGRVRSVNDTWIAVCCLVRDLPLATLNVKDYADFARYESLALLPR